VTPQAAQMSDDARPDPAPQRTILFDTDPGVDDALALLFLHLHPAIELAAITTVAGNGTIEAVTRNALFVAERFGIAAPIARGAANPVEGELHRPPTGIHGENALGDIALPARCSRDLDARPAHRLIIDTVRARPGSVTLLAVGMLTNLERAIREDPEIVTLVRDVVVMGGGFGTDGRHGNATPAAEANFHGDPAAADRVCTAGWPLTIVGLDVTETIVMSNAYLADLRERGGTAGRFVYEVSRGYADFHRRRGGLDGIFAHDPSAAVCALDAEAFTFRDGPVRVATGDLFGGASIQKYAGREFGPSGWDGLPSARVAIAVDAQRVLDIFAGAFRGDTPSA
jgi:inosine-uridine nucleoside N-ribohydrolase